MKIAVCPGSFDPITMGHVDIINRAAKLFDKVIVVVSINPAKQATFSVEQRMEFIRRSLGHNPQIEVDYTDGLLADFVKEHGACAIVKGLRAVTDFEYEFQMALANQKLNPEAETVFLSTQGENMYLSSSLVRQICRFGGDVSGFVPKQILDEITNVLGK